MSRLGLLAFLLALPARADDATDALAKELRDYADRRTGQGPRQGRQVQHRPARLPQPADQGGQRSATARRGPRSTPRPTGRSSATQRIAALRKSLGTFPDGAEDMRVTITKTIEAGDYAIDNLLYESRPGRVGHRQPVPARPKPRAKMPGS